jgi:hypothetical protein
VTRHPLVETKADRTSGMPSPGLSRCLRIKSSLLAASYLREPVAVACMLEAVRKRAWEKFSSMQSGVGAGGRP